MNVLVSSKLKTAQQLIIENEWSLMTQKSLFRPLGRLMHNETLHALRPVNSSLSSIAYAILDDAGQIVKHG